MIDLLLDRYLYLLVGVLLGIGLYGMLGRRHLVKKVIGMMIFHTAIYLFFIGGSVRQGGAPPVITPKLGPEPEHYVNPLPHLMILTAIVVGVGLAGIAFSLVLQIHRDHGTLDEEDIIARLGRGEVGSPEGGGPRP